MKRRNISCTKQWLISIRSIKAQCVLQKAEITVLEKVGDNDYIVDYNGIKCHAIFNFFTGCYYADDIYGVVVE